MVQSCPLDTEVAFGQKNFFLEFLVLIAYGSKREEVFIELSDVPNWYILPTKHFLLETLPKRRAHETYQKFGQKNWSEFHL